MRNLLGKLLDQNMADVNHQANLFWKLLADVDRWSGIWMELEVHTTRLG